MMKRILAVLLACMLLLSVVPVTQIAAVTEGAAEAVTQDAETPEEPTDEEPATDEEGRTLVTLYDGDPTVSKEDAMTLLFLGDGFTEEEQEAFFEYAQGAADYLMTVAPWSEFYRNVKIYAYSTPSNESGVKGDSASNYNDALADERDTYYESSYWYGGTQRMMALNEDTLHAVEKKLADEYGIVTSADVVLVNSQLEGGCAYWPYPMGDRDAVGYVILSVDPTVNVCTVHELGHLIAWLQDEYWPGAGSEDYVNMTSESDPELVKWSRYIGMEGVGVYEYNGGPGWYHPSQNCLMQILSVNNNFCPICADTLRDEIAARSNVINIQFQPYGDQFYQNEGKDMSEYFIIRQGEVKVTGDQLPEGTFTLTYYDADGNVVEGTPDVAGDYTVQAVFTGATVDGVTLDPCEQTGTYTIQLPNLVTINVADKLYDGEPIEVSYTVDESLEEGSYYTEVIYTGTFPYSKNPNATYESTEAPVIQGNYTVTVYVYDSETDELITKKPTNFEIGFSTVNIVYNSDPAWPGSDSADSNFTYYVFGDGYTAEEQDKFLEDATEFVNNLLLQEPYRQMASYFNFIAVPTPSNTSGISDPDGDTYFGLTYDENGKINATYASSAIAGTISYNKLDPYYRNAFILVNDENVTEGSFSANYEYHGTVYAAPNEAGAVYAARAASEIYVSLSENGSVYAIQSDVEKNMEGELTQERIEYQRYYMLEWLAYGGYTMILTDAYNGDFVENGEPVDITPYLHTYSASILIPNDMIEYDITYYADDNGEVGEQLDGAPSAAGTYHAFVTQVPSYTVYLEGDFDTISLDGMSYDVIYNPDFLDYTTYYDELIVTKAWASFTIKPAAPDVTEPGTEPTEPGTEEPTEPSTEEPTEPVEPTEPGTGSETDNPKTGESTDLALLVALMALSLAGVVGTTVFFNKKKI